MSDSRSNDSNSPIGNKLAKKKNEKHKVIESWTSLNKELKALKKITNKSALEEGDDIFEKTSEKHLS